MSDLIDRQKAINVIERMRAYIGHNMERAVGAAFIEILDDVGEDIGRLPSIQFATDTNVGTKLSADLAEVGTDCISRQALLKQIDIDSDGEPGYYGDTWKFIDTIKSLPSAQPENIRCKDCKWKNRHNCTRAVEVFIDDDKYCAWAERRTDE
jgi:hypothetical protein